MITLFFAPKTRAIRPRWALEETGIPYSLHRMDLKLGQHKTPEYLAIHPHGKVPALKHGEMLIFESAAIVAYIADQFSAGDLSPRADHAERSSYLQWMFYATATLEGPIQTYHSHTIRLPEHLRLNTVAQEARMKFYESAQILSKALGNQEYFLKAGFSAIDILIGSMLSWGGQMERMGLLADYPILRRYAERCMQRPAYVRAADTAA